jgi:hypothetical protein
MKPFTLSLILLSHAALCQSSETQPSFEGADVHVSAPTRFPSMRGPFLRGSRYELRSASMVDLIATAYGIDAEDVGAVPVGWKWTDSTCPPKRPRILSGKPGSSC